MVSIRVGVHLSLIYRSSISKFSLYIGRRTPVYTVVLTNMLREVKSLIIDMLEDNNKTESEKCHVLDCVIYG